MYDEVGFALCVLAIRKLVLEGSVPADAVVAQPWPSVFPCPAAAHVNHSASVANASAGPSQTAWSDGDTTSPVLPPGFTRVSADYVPTSAESPFLECLL